MASDAIGGAIDRHLDVRLAFQDCHRAAVFRPEARREHADFITARSQIVNQSPALLNCWEIQGAGKAAPGL